MTSAAVQPPIFSVEGKTAIITGGGSGIGFSFATLLLSRNCNVAIADISLRPEAKRLIDAHTSSSPRAIFIPTDVRSWPALRNMFEKTIAVFGSFDILCPCAGVYEPHWSNFWHPPESSSEARDDANAEFGHYATLDINVTHPIRATQLALSYWMHDNKGSGENRPPKRIIHISSVAAQVPLFSNPIYGASKGAITNFVRSLAPLEPEVNVRVNAVAPGLIRTPLWIDHPEKLAYVDPATDHWATSEEVAEAMVRCLEDPALSGGTILEVGKEHTRVVKAYGAKGPDPDPKKGLLTASGEVGYRDALRWLMEEGWGRPKSKL